MASEKEKQNLLFYIVPLLATLFLLVTYKAPGFHRDELLYFSLGQHPAAGYYSVPPFTGLMAYLSVKLFGYTLFSAKFFPAIAGGMLIMVTGLMAKEMKGGLYAQVLAAVSFFCTLLFMRAFSLFQPVPFDVLFWSVLFWILLKYINEERNSLLLLFGIISGIAILNKYNVVFLLLPVLVLLLLSKYRRIYSKSAFWKAAAAAVIIIAPNIVWQAIHGFPVISHMQELKSSQLVNMSAATFLSEQFLMVFPATLIILPGLFYLLFSHGMSKYRMAGIVAVGVLLLFLLLQGKSYYSAGIYPMLTAAGAVFVARILRYKPARILIVLFMLTLAFLALPMGKPVYKPARLAAWFDKAEEITGSDAVRRDEDNNYNRLPQDYADMLGWDELAAITARAWNKVEDKKGCMIFCENYGQAGAIAVLGKQYGLPDPVSFSESFYYWAPRYFDYPVSTLIYINDELGDDVKALFSTITPEGFISNPYARERGTCVYVCSNPLTDFNGFWKQQFEED